MTTKYKPMPITVVTYLNGEPEAERTIDYNDQIHRKWLGAHCYWAFCNGRSVETGAPEIMRINLSEDVE